MIVFVSVVITLGCIAASLRRLYFATNPTAFDHALLAKLVKDSPERFARLVSAPSESSEAGATLWEKELLDAVRHPDRIARNALVNEQLGEFEYRVKRWVQVPRVCARVASTSGFLLASLVLRSGLKDLASLMSGDAMQIATSGPIAQALSVVTLGMMGGAFCLVFQERARKAEKANFSAVDALVDAAEEAFSP